MQAEYPVLVVDPATALSLEQVGSKYKFWFRDGVRKGVFKLGRPGSGEHWSERIASELARLLGLPHAVYEFAATAWFPGVVSWSFTAEFGDEPIESLTLGNQILSQFDPGYPRAERPGEYCRVPQHTVELVLSKCETVAPPLRWTAPAIIQNGADVMVGYLMFDAWIGNTDRHDENWGWVKPVDSPRSHLAPTFDHASSLGRLLQDDDRTRRLTTTDPRATPGAYALRARSALYRPPDAAAGEAEPVLMTTLDAFRRAAALRPEAARFWEARLRATFTNRWDEVIGRVPERLMSRPARQFASAMLTATRAAIIGEHQS